MQNGRQVEESVKENPGLTITQDEVRTSMAFNHRMLKTGASDGNCLYFGNSFYMFNSSFNVFNALKLCLVVQMYYV